MLLGKLPWLEASLRPLIVISQVAPKVAFIPLFVIWFGFGITSKIWLSALLAFFPIMLNMLLGVRSVEQGHREVMSSLNASRAQTLLQLEMRSVQPYLFAGMEVGIVLATTGAIVGEYIAGSQGLGFLVVSSMNQLDAGAHLRPHPVALAHGAGPVPDRQRAEALLHPVARVGVRPAQHLRLTPRRKSRPLGDRLFRDARTDRDA